MAENPPRASAVRRTTILSPEISPASKAIDTLAQKGDDDQSSEISPTSSKAIDQLAEKDDDDQSSEISPASKEAIEKIAEKDDHDQLSPRFGSKVQDKSIANSKAATKASGKDQIANVSPTTGDKNDSVSPPSGLPNQSGIQPTPVEDPVDEACGPGAYAMLGPGFRSSRRRGSLSERSSTLHQTTSELDSSDNAGLVVADQVDDELNPLELQQARSVDRQKVVRNRREQAAKQFWTAALLVAVVLVAIVMVLLALLIPNKEPDAGTVLPTVNPSVAAMPPEDFILSLLHEDTIHAITADPDSPQSLALDWLMQDIENLLYLPVERIMQKYALATLYFATGGDRWNANEHWLDHSIHECEWAGKRDFAMKSILSMIYPGYLEGFLEPPPTSMCDANGMYQHLWLDQNKLVGALPEELYMLTSLVTLSMGFNRLRGEISSSIGQLSLLQGLGIYNLENAGPVPTEIGLLSALKSLSLANNDHCGSIPSELWSLSHLEFFSLADNPNLKGSLPSKLGSLSRLKMLFMPVSGLTGTIPTEIGKVKSLGTIYMSQSQLTGTVPSELGLLSKLTLLSLFDGLLEGAIPTELGRANSLFLISLRGNSLTGALPSELGLLTNLQYTLNLRSNQLTEAIPTELGLLTKLRELELANNALSGNVPSQFGYLSSMGQLTLAQNNLSGSVPQALWQLRDTLYNLKLDGNPLLSGTIPDDLCSLDAKCVNSAMNPCERAYGLSFNCTTLLCGCDCPCNTKN